MDYQGNRVFNVEPQYISNPENDEFVTIYRNKTDGLYYGRRKNGTDEPLYKNVDNFKKIVMKFRENGGEPEVVFYENTTLTNLSFDRIGTGDYLVQSDGNPFTNNLFYYQGVVTGRATIIPISDTSDTIGFLYVRYSNDTRFRIKVLDKNYNPINIESLIGNNWFNLPEIKIYN